MAHLSPNDLPLRNLLDAAGALKEYGIPLDSPITAGLLTEISRQTSSEPLEVYIFAAQNDLFPLARETSSYLLNVTLGQISDDVALRIGSKYLSLLYTLVTARQDVLRRLISQPPNAHEPTSSCGKREYQRLTASWVSTASAFVVRVDPSVTPENIQSGLGPLGESVSCQECQRRIRDRVRDIVTSWSRVPRSISSDRDDFYAVLPE